MCFFGLGKMLTMCLMKVMGVQDLGEVGVMLRVWGNAASVMGRREGWGGVGWGCGCGGGDRESSGGMDFDEFLRQ